MEEKVKQQYDRWLSQSGMPADLADELNRIAGDEDAITDRFYRELEFGTGDRRRHQPDERLQHPQGNAGSCQLPERL